MFLAILMSMWVLLVESPSYRIWGWDVVPTSFPCNHLTTLPKVVAQSDKTLSLKIMFKEITFVLASLEGGPWILGHNIVEHLAMNPPLDWFNMNFVGPLSFGHLAIVSPIVRP
jgi:hypothetical protein